ALLFHPAEVRRPEPAEAPEPAAGLGARALLDLPRLLLLLLAEPELPRHLGPGERRGALALEPQLLEPLELRGVQDRRQFRVGGLRRLLRLLPDGGHAALPFLRLEVLELLEVHAFEGLANLLLQLGLEGLDLLLLLVAGPDLLLDLRHGQQRKAGRRLA